MSRQNSTQLSTEQNFLSLTQTSKSQVLAPLYQTLQSTFSYHNTVHTPPQPGNVHPRGFNASLPDHFSFHKKCSILFNSPGIYNLSSIDSITEIQEFLQAVTKTINPLLHFPSGHFYLHTRHIERLSKTLWQEILQFFRVSHYPLQHSNYRSRTIPNPV